MGTQHLVRVDTLILSFRPSEEGTTGGVRAHSQCEEMPAHITDDENHGRTDRTRVAPTRRVALEWNAGVSPEAPGPAFVEPLED